MTAPAGPELLTYGVVGDEGYRRIQLQGRFLGAAPADGLNPGFLAIVGAVFTAIEAISTAVKTAKMDGNLFGVLAGAAVVARELREPLEKKFPELAKFIGQESGRVGNILGNVGEVALNEIADVALAAAGDTADATDQAPLKSLAGHIAMVEPTLREEARSVLNAAKSGPLALLEKLVGDMAAKILGMYKDVIELRRDELPDHVEDVAGAAIGAAFSAGLVAMTGAAAIEAIPAFRGLGLQQSVGLVAGFAGFDQITRPAIGPTLDFGLGLPSRQQAAKWFRTRRPGGRDVREQAYQRHVTLEDYAESLRLEGYPEDWIKVLVADTWQDPSPRELILLSENTDVDETWLAGQLREVGWDDHNVEQGTRALTEKLVAPGRMKLVGQLGTSYTRGHIDLAQLQGQLGVLIRNPHHRSLWLGAFINQRRSAVMEELADAVTAQYQGDVITEHAARESLTALGMAADEVTRRIALTGLKRNQRMIAREEATTEAAVRTLKTQAFTELRAQFRAGLVDHDQALTYAIAFGFHPAYAESVLALEALRGPPRTQTGEVPIGTGALEDAAAAIQEFVMEAGARKQIGAVTALRLLVEAGVPLTLAERAALLIEIFTRPPDPGIAWPFKNLTADQLIWTKALASIGKALADGTGVGGLIGDLFGKLNLGTEAPGVAGILDGLLKVFGRRKDRTRKKVKVQVPAEPDAPTGPPPPEPPTPEDPETRPTLAFQVRAAVATLRQLNEELRVLALPPVPVPGDYAEPLEEQSNAYLQMLLVELEPLIARAREELQLAGGTLPPGFTEDHARQYRELVTLYAEFAELAVAIVARGGAAVPPLPPLPPLEQFGDRGYLSEVIGQTTARVEELRIELARLVGSIDRPPGGGTVTRRPFPPLEPPPSSQP